MRKLIGPDVLPGATRKVMKNVLSVMPHTKIAEKRGAGIRGEVGKYCREKGYRNVLVVTGPIVGKLEIIDKLYQGLEEEKIRYTTFDGILSDPVFSGCREGSAAAKRNNVDAIIAFGGGSVMDTAKIIAATMAYPKSAFARFTVPFTAFRRFPVIMIPTTAGTGCEVTFGSIISDDKTRLKKNIGGPGYTPEICFLDVETTKDLSPELTAATGMDALAHLIENYLSAVPDKDCKNMCREAIRDVFEYLPRAYRNGSEDMAAREKMMDCANKGGQAINISGCVHGHALAHAIGGICHIHHGRICGIILPEILRYYQKYCGQELAELAVFCEMGTPDESSDVLSKRLVDRVFALRESLDLPEKIEEMKKDNLAAIRKEFWKQSLLYPTPTSMREEELDEILENLLMDTL